MSSAKWRPFCLGLNELNNDDSVLWQQVVSQRGYHFVYAPSQWETTLQCNAVSHWLGSYTKWSLQQEALQQDFQEKVFESVHHLDQPRVAWTWRIIIVYI